MLTGAEALVRGLVAGGVRTIWGTPPVDESWARGSHYSQAVDAGVAATLALSGALLAENATAIILGPGGMRRAFDAFGGLGLLNELESACVVVDYDPSSESRALHVAAHVAQLEVSSVEELESMAVLACALSRRMGMPIGLRVAPELLLLSVEAGESAPAATATGPRFVREAGPYTFRAGDRSSSFHLQKRQRRWRELARWSDILVEDLGRDGKKAVIAAGDLPRSAMARAWARRLPVLRLGMVAPLPEERVVAFLRSRSEVLVLERGDGLIAGALKLLCHDRGLACRILSEPLAIDDERIDLALGRFGGRVRAEADPPPRDAARFATIAESIGTIEEDDREPWPLYLARQRKNAPRLGRTETDARRRLLEALRATTRPTTIAASDSSLVERAFADQLVDVVAPMGSAAAVAGGLVHRGAGPAPLSVALVDEAALYAGELDGILDNVRGQREILHVLLVTRGRGKATGLSDEQLEGLLRSAGLKVASVHLDDADLAGAVAYALSRTGARALLCLAGG